MQERAVASVWFEILSVIHLMSMLTLSEANALMIPRDYSGSGVRVVSTGWLLKLMWPLLWMLSICFFFQNFPLLLTRCLYKLWQIVRGSLLICCLRHQGIWNSVSKTYLPAHQWRSSMEINLLSFVAFTILRESV